ncbi:MAG: type I restriction-modification enzyme R subunit C-terminal domain-containing protein [Sedimenticola sp.]|nr:type I restriction-modification enzyme R subunit C-terminal domain-containing protein [Sedimenticola sp.]
MTPPEGTLNEAETREQIDAALISAGWVIQDKKRLNLFESLGVVVREMDTDTGPADYMLFVDGKACGIIEAKREGAGLGGVAEQSARYATSTTQYIERWLAEDQPLPFQYEATNHEIRFRDERDPHPRSRYVFHFHKPETLKYWLEEGDTLRARMQSLPELNTDNLRLCQIDAIHGIEHSLKQGKPRALLQMATGSGKTYTAVTEVYRLAKFAKIKRALFLVDRGNLATNAKDEFEQFVIPHDGRKFTQHYNVNILGRAGIPDATKVTISTIQRLYAQLTGQELDDEVDEHSGFEVEASTINKAPRPVSYNPGIPIEEFDVIIIDECHRSIYNLWRQVLEYFDAFLIGLTATPTKKTIGFFGQNLVSEYTHEDAVVDKVNVGYDIYRIKTELTEQGNTIEAGTAVEVRDRLTKQKRLEVLDQQEDWLAQQLDRSVLAPNQIRTVIQAYKDRCLPECFPERLWSKSSLPQGDATNKPPLPQGEGWGEGGLSCRMEWVPKTLIFAKDDDHCDRIVDAVREVFDEGNAFCKKITYKIGKRAAEESIKAFRTDPQFRIVVTVDMIATGTDIRPLECVMFMRDVKSQAYYEQMKGRGTRVISRDELHKVTPDAPGKSRFVLVDCVGVTETDKTETKSLETKPSISTAKLMEQVARGDRHSDTLRALGNRMIRLDLKLNDQQRKRVNDLIKEIVGWGEERTPTPGATELLPPTTLTAIASNLIHSTNEEHLVKSAQAQVGKEEVTEQQIQASFKPKADELIKPFHNPDLRELIETLRKDTDQLIDDSADELITAGYDEEKAEVLIKNWQQFIQDHKNELDAIQLIYQQPYQKRHLSYEQIEKLAEEIQQPPYNLAPIEVWKAYEQLEKNKVKGVPPKELLTNIVSLIRFSIGLSDVLEPFTELVNNRFDNWLKQQELTPSPVPGEGWGESKKFSPDQLAWLNKIKDQIAQNAEMTVEDFNYIPFNQEGGLLKARELFGKELEPLISELNGFLIA